MKIKSIVFLSDYWNGIKAGETYDRDGFKAVFGERAFNLILFYLDYATEEEIERGYFDISDIFDLRVYLEKN